MAQPAYLLTGEAFLADEALERIRADEATDPLSEVILDSSADGATIVEAVSTASLLGGRRLVVVHDAQDLKKQQCEPIAAYLEHPSPDSVLVLIASGKSKAEAAVRKAGAVIALEAPKGRSLLTWIKDRARRSGLKLDDAAGWALIDSVGTTLRDLDAALSQLLTALGPSAAVDAAAVRHAFPRLADERIYAFTDAVGDRRMPQAMGTLRRLLEQGDDPLMLFGSLSGQVRRMLRARRVADGGPAAVGDAMGLPRWRAERLARQAKAYREEELVAAMEVLATTDVEMKGGDLPSEIALERAVHQIIAGHHARLGN